MIIWLLTTALLGSTAWLARGAVPIDAAALWLSWIAVLAVTPSLARRLKPLPAAMFGLIAAALLVAVTLFLFPNQPIAGSLATGFVVGGAAGMDARFRVGSTRVASSLIAGIWIGLHTIVLGASPQEADWVVFSLAAVLAGILLGRILQWQEFALSDPDAWGDPEKLLRAGKAAMDELDLDRARHLLDRAAELAPDHLELRRVQYAAWKFNPRAQQFHEVAGELLALADDSFMARCYQDYLAVTQVRPNLPAELHLDLARRLARAGDPDEAARIANLHLQRDSETPGLPAALMNTAEAYLETGKGSKAVRYADTIVTLFPETEQARRAEALIEEITGYRAGDSQSQDA